MIYVNIQSNRFRKQIEYVFNTIFFILGVPIEYVENTNRQNATGQDILIGYVDDLENTFDNFSLYDHIIVIRNSGRLFGDGYLKVSSIPDSVKHISLAETHKAGSAVSIFHRDPQPYIRKELNGSKKYIITNMDMISDVFFMITRYEEVINAMISEKDEFKRFPAKKSLACNNNFLNRPIVNEHIELLWSWIDSFQLGYERKNWWKSRDFAVCLTHDVDCVQKNKNLYDVGKHMIAALLKLGNIKKAFTYALNSIKNLSDYSKDPYWIFDYIMGFEKQFGFNSSFYFMSLPVSDPDNRYDIRDIKIKKLIYEIESQGFEAGYHGSLNSYNDLESMEKEKERLDGVVLKKPYGCRQHYLMFKPPFTWRYQKKAGILYDTTLSFAEHEGFRCGICFPYKPYDIIDDTILDIWEIPLLIMEVTLQAPEYRSLSPEAGLKNIIGIIETVKRYKGVFTLLWHNSSFDYNWNGWKCVFEETIRYLCGSNCLALSGREIVEYIRLHSYA